MIKNLIILTSLLVFVASQNICQSYTDIDNCTNSQECHWYQEECFQIFNADDHEDTLIAVVIIFLAVFLCTTVAVTYFLCNFCDCQRNVVMIECCTCTDRSPID